MSDADTVVLRRLKDWILKMTSYVPNSRPKIKDVYELIQRIVKGLIGESNKARYCTTSLYI